MKNSIYQLSGVGDAIAGLLAKLNITTPTDLLFHLPRDYEDRSHITLIKQARVGQSVLLEGSVQFAELTSNNKTLVVQLADSSGKFYLRFFRLYRGLAEKFAVGSLLRVFGELKWGNFGLELHHPEMQVVRPNMPLPEARLTPIYPLTEGLTQAKLRQLVNQVLAKPEYWTHLPDLLPLRTGALEEYDLISALRYIHQPPADAPIALLLAGQHPAQQRLVLEELIAHQVSMLTRRQHLQALKAPAFTSSQRLAPALLAALPFSPTHAQQTVCTEIYQDLAHSKTMLRLVQGDVGAGKTLVAALAACQVLEAGWQVALMAPTEILAEQHFINFTHWFTPLGINVSWLSGKQKGKARAVAEASVATGSAQLVIGTHALFQDAVTFAKLGLVIIDEQHRFGVAQRMSLRDKGVQASDDQQQAMSPHQLIMTATPIPRTLAMSVYGDLDTSVINALPPGRTPITTVTLPIERRADVMARVAANCAQGKQAYWVCTLVEESEVLDAQAAESAFAMLQTSLPNIRVGLVHGRLKSDEKAAVMAAFKAGKIQLLVATTVIEVGVDVPNASLMIIENAERLGLSQLHQLRGRVGRGAVASFCVLLYKTPLSANGIERLSILRASNDGFVIAEKDLALRGPGEVLGTRQTGDLGFRLVQLHRDQHLLPQAKQLAMKLLQLHPHLAAQLVQRWLPQATRYIAV